MKKVYNLCKKFTVIIQKSILSSKIQGVQKSVFELYETTRRKKNKNSLNLYIKFISALSFISIKKA